METEAGGPAGEVVGDHVEGEPGGVGAEPAGREVVEPNPVFEVADGVLDHGVAAVIRLEFNGVALAVRDEGVVGPFGEQAKVGCGGSGGRGAR